MIMGACFSLVFWRMAMMLSPGGVILVGAATTTTAPHGQKAGGGTMTPMKVRRERNLDHLDSDTLRYYLHEYPGYDVAIMFYAMWDTHSRNLAPYWDSIATVAKAGTTDSNLVMGLFDCELNAAHIDLCEEVGITHYPTLLFVGSGPYHDTDPITSTIFGQTRSAGHMGHALIRNTVKFQGDWRYIDSMLDWIRAMQALSNWHSRRKGFWELLWRILWSRDNPPLPIGIPGGGPRRTTKRGGASSSSGTGSAVNEVRKDLLERHAELLEKKTMEMEELEVRAGALVDALIFGNTSAKDMFSIIDKRQAWWCKDPIDEIDEVYHFCLVDLSLNYCERVKAHMERKIMEELESTNMTSDQLHKIVETFEMDVKALVSEQEPYCGIFLNCITTNFKDETCRPKACPFSNVAACRYLTSCTDPDLMLFYTNRMIIID
jgi:Thioredoxin